MSFERAVAHVLRWEGVDSNHRADPGGLTRLGISARAYPDLDIRRLTVDEAKAIYRRDYWAKARCEEIPSRIAFALFDAAVNVGVEQAVKLLQRALGVKVDGDFGPVTLAAVKAVNETRLIRDFTVERLAFYMSLPTYPVFGRGWIRRSIDTVIHA